MPAMTLRIPPDILPYLDQVARDERRSRTAQILVYLRRALEAEHRLSARGGNPRAVLP